MTQSDRSSRLPKPACNVVLGFFSRWLLEYDIRPVELNELSEQEKPGVVGHTGCLLHIVGHNHDRTTGNKVK